MKEKEIIVTKKVTKVYNMGTVEVRALGGVTIKIKKGDFVAIVGASGSGKSTLLHILGLLDTATKGKIIIDGSSVENLTEKEKSLFRLNKLGYVFQEYALLPELTALENVALVQWQKGTNIKLGKLQAIDILKKVGLGDRINHYPSELSGGQQQRVAIARALVSKPMILFADEPTANLDSKTTKEILKLFVKLNKDFGQTIVMVSHEPEHQKYVKRIIKLKDGLIM